MNKYIKISFVLIFTLAVVLRTLLYLGNRSLWMDEAFLATLLTDMSPLQILTGTVHPSVPVQATNPGFLILTRFVTDIFGLSEFSLRFIPYASGLLGVFAFYRLTRIFLSSLRSRLIALLLFAVNIPLLYFSQEFKPYTSDVLIIVIILLIFLKLNLDNMKKYLSVSFLFACFIWISYAAWIVLFSCGLILVAENFHQKFKQTLIFIIPQALSAALFMILFGRNSLSAYSYFDYWKNGFVFHLKDVLTVLNNAVQFIFEPNYSVLILVLCFIGLFLLFKEQKSTALFLFAPIAVAICLACLKLYPFDGRVILFTAPIFIIAAIKVLDYYPKFTFIIVAIAFGTYLTLSPSRFVNANFYSHENIRQVVLTLKENIKPGDKIYIPVSSSVQFFRYTALYPVDYSGVVIDTVSFSDEINKNVLYSLKKGQKYWFVSAPELDWFSGNNFSISEFVENNCIIINKYSHEPSFLYYAEIK